MDQTDANIRAECLRLLTGREHSRKELLHKLAIKGFTRERSEPILEALTAEKWQSDARYAESYARSRILKGYGPAFIAYELGQRGIDLEKTPSFDLEALAESVGGWMAVLRQVYLKKYGDGPVPNRNEWAKRSRFLLQRGFTNAMITHLLKNTSNTF
ncbi:regulatory protein RecX [Methylomicrobium sp. Wu6]|uniref:regulatory protein RecX n=1 Tax=Methylomicrobium sp. Wu6 TaxID=3107928 RepID=UPI002DD69F9F|nr:regulatory protein RecX [Methylomicrobium sp. Wu6]MEC4747911.1 regulatory protein RecX [Methylomicrobium sp. Wu6]